MLRDIADAGRQVRRWAAGALVLPLLVPWPPPAMAMEVIKQCAAGEAHVIGVSAEPLPASRADARQESIESVPEPGGVAKLIVRGPVLGSMDSSEVGIAIACARKGLVLTATITRSADFHGAVRQNQIWLPRITIGVKSHRPAIIFQVVWRMRLTTGAMVGHARTPPVYSVRKYPITITTTIRARPASPV